MYPNATTITNVTQLLSAVHSRSRRHPSYLKPHGLPNCYLATEFIVEADEACNFVRSTEACYEMVALFNYLEYMICDLGINGSLLGIIKLISFTAVILITYIVVLMLLTYFFIVPNFLTVATHFNMVGHQFGMTLVAALMVLPDLIFRRPECSEYKRNGSLLLSESIGKIVSCLCVGIMVIGFWKPTTAPSSVSPRVYIVNGVLLLGGAIYLERILDSDLSYDAQSASLQPAHNVRIHAIISTIFYLCYLILLIATSLRKKLSNDDDLESYDTDSIGPDPRNQPVASFSSERIGRTENEMSAQSSIFSDENPPSEQHSDPSIDWNDKVLKIQNLHQDEGSPSVIHPVVTAGSAISQSMDSSDIEANFDRISMVSIDTIGSDEYPHDDGSPLDPDVDMWTTILNAINPFAHIEGVPKLFVFTLLPLWFLCAIMIPVIDHGRPMLGWCKLVVCISFLMLPVILKMLFISPYVFNGLMLLGIMASTLTYFLTHSRRIPLYNHYFSVLGLAICFTLYTILDQELDTLLMQVLSYLDNWKHDPVVILFRPLPYCVLQIVLCLALMKRGYVDMAFGIAIGISIFVTFTTLPNVVLHPCYDTDQAPLMTADAATAYVFLMIIVVTLAISISMTNFDVGWSHAFYALIMYFLLFLYMIFSISWVIHPFGTEHDIVLDKEENLGNWA